MENLFKEEDLQTFVKKYADYPKELALLVYTSRLIGGDSSLVLHGGGNTSVKMTIKNIVGEENNVIFVKGSGHDMSDIEPEGFTGLNLNPIRKLRSLESLSAEEMDNQLKIHRIASHAPDPSVERFCMLFFLINMLITPTLTASLY